MTALIFAHEYAKACICMCDVSCIPSLLIAWGDAKCRVGWVAWIPIVPFVGERGIAAGYSPCGDYIGFCCTLVVSLSASLVLAPFCCAFLAICVDLSNITPSSVDPSDFHLSLVGIPSHAIF